MHMLACCERHMLKLLCFEAKPHTAPAAAAQIIYILHVHVRLTQSLCQGSSVPIQACLPRCEGHTLESRIVYM